MKNKIIAYLIQAHNNEKHLYEMISSLNNKEVSFFVHIDKKSNIKIFKKLFINFSNVYFVEKRINVVWKGFSQVEATISTVRLALKSDFEFKYFILLSGVDYPIKSNKYILDFFKKTDKNYLEFQQIKKSNSYIEYFKNKQLWFKISKWHFYDNLKINWSGKSGSIKNIFYRIWIIFNVIFINFLKENKKIDKNIKYYFGSSWWCFNNETIKYIINFYENNKNFNNIFKYADASDEMYFQTIILNSKIKDSCINNNFRYIDWDIKREGPAILNVNDFSNIKKSDSIFARKFGQRSIELIKMIKDDIVK